MNKYQCRECSEQFKYRAQRITHEKQEHNRVSDPRGRPVTRSAASDRVQCRECEKTYSDTSGRRKHEKQEHNRVSNPRGPVPNLQVATAQPVRPDSALSRLMALINRTHK